MSCHSSVATSLTAVELGGVAVSPLETDPPEPDTFPDGGLEAWATVVGAWLVLFSTLGYIYSFGVYQDYYTRIYLPSYSPSQISWIGSVQLAMPFGLGLVSGKLHDDGHFHVLVISGSALFAISLFMLSLCHPGQYYQIFLSQALGMGIGLGLIFVPTVSVTSQHFKRRRALATGIAFIGTSCGAIVFPIMLNKLFANGQYGFGWGTRISAFVVLACLILGNALMRTRPITGTGRAAPQPSKPSVGKFLRDEPYMLSIFGAFMANLSIYFPVFYIQLFAVNHGLDENLAFYSLAILNAGAAAGRGTANLLVDTYGPLNVLTPAAFVSGGLIVAMIGIHSNAALVLVSLIYGFFSGAFISVVVALVAFLSDDASEIGMRMGLAFTVQFLANLVAAPIQGALLTSTQYKWGRPIAFSATLVFAATVAFTFARFALAKKRGRSLV